MAKILCAWEIGNSTGHVRNLVPLAAALRAAGHTVDATFRTTEKAAHIHAGRAFDTFIPLFRIKPLDVTLRLGSLAYAAATYMDVLTAYAYYSLDSLNAAVAIAKDMLEGYDAVMAECAPTFILAAKLTGKKVIGVGTSFGLPDWETIYTYPSFAGEAKTPLVNAAQFLALLQGSSLGHKSTLSDYLTPDAQMPYCYPALDVYGSTRAAPAACTPVVHISKQPAPGEPSAFAYVSTDYPSLKGLLDQLMALPMPVRLYTVGDARRSGAVGNITLLQQRFDLDEEMRRASFVIHHGSAGIANAALSAGLPQFILPYHLENTLNAAALNPTGVCSVIGYDYAGTLGLNIQQHLSGLTATAQTVADAQVWNDPITKTVSILEELLNG